MVLPIWWKNGRRLVNNGLVKIENSSLIINDTTIEDKGNYSCWTLQVYENSAIRQKFTFPVKVAGEYFYAIMEKCSKVFNKRNV